MTFYWCGESQAKTRVVSKAKTQAKVFLLNCHTEFLEIFNHYILKEKEHGIVMREYRNYHMPLYVNEKFGMNEPQPLAYNNVMFVFMCLGMGIVISMSLALVEKIHELLTHSRLSMYPPP